MNIFENFFVVSLPRSGTKSICKMAGIVGLKFKHVPSINLLNLINQKQYNFFADTPCYTPSFIEKLKTNNINKFIYIDRDCNEWYNSFKNSGLINNYSTLLRRDVSMLPYNQLDKNCLNEVFSESLDEETIKESYIKHREYCLDIPNILVYNFSDGWGTFCEFTGTEKPDCDIPIVNRGTLYEKF